MRDKYYQWDADDAHFKMYNCIHTYYTSVYNRVSSEVKCHIKESLPADVSRHVAPLSSVTCHVAEPRDSVTSVVRTATPVLGAVMVMMVVLMTMMMFMMVKTSAARSVTNMLAASRGDETELDLSAVTGNGSLVRDLQWLNKLGTLHLSLIVVTFFIFSDTNDTMQCQMCNKSILHTGCFRVISKSKTGK